MARRFLLEVLLYATFAIAYFFLVLRWLSDPLVALAEESRIAYAVIGLIIIVLQGILLDWLTSQIMVRIDWHRSVD